VLKAAMGIAVLSGLIACSTPPTTGDSEGAGGGVGGGCVGTSCRHGDSAGGNVSSSSGASGGSSGGLANGGTSTGGSSGGSTSGGAAGGSSSTGGGGDQLYTCETTQGYTGDGGYLCGDGGWFASELIDLVSCDPLGGVALQAIGADGVPITGASATSDATTGVFALCVPEQEPLTMSFSLANYPQTYYQESLGTEQIDWIGMLDNSTINEIATFFPGGVDPSGGIVGIFFSTGNSGCAIDNWGVALTLPDGGAIPDGGAALVYLDPMSIPEPSLTSTSGAGIAVFYNIDTTTTSFFQVTTTNLDAGACAPQNAADGFTGRVFVGSGAVTYVIYRL
jgi:hypothetical protein